jgi:RHS repeat-associated protein
VKSSGDRIPTILSIDGAGVRTVASSPSGNRFLYTGREWEPEAGYYHYRHRTYHPTDRRFMQADPIGLGGGWNHYAYVGGNPVMASDPMGLETINVRIPDGESFKIFPIEVEDGMDSEWKRRLYTVFLMHSELRDLYASLTPCSKNKGYSQIHFKKKYMFIAAGKYDLSFSKVPWVIFDDDAFFVKDDDIPQNTKYPKMSEDEWKSTIQYLWFASALYHELVHARQNLCGGQTVAQTTGHSNERSAYTEQWNNVLSPGFLELTDSVPENWEKWFRKKLKKYSGD